MTSSIHTATDRSARLDMGGLKYLFAHMAWAPYAMRWHQDLVQRHRARGFDVESFCLTPNAPGPHYSFAELDRKWRRRERAVVELHDNLLAALNGKDVLINFNGANIHPEWLADFKTFNVYLCWDDPESSAELSEPVARYYDFALTGNLACVPLYQSWEITRCAHLPLGLHEGEYDPAMTPERILEADRPNDILFLGERKNPWRRERLARLKEAFPEAKTHGRGWPEGFLPDEEKLPTLAASKIGWNLHNSVGPVNLRVFSLPANGLLQICDNKCRVGQLFELGREIVGFDTIDECIELTRYYLAHDRERREIAARGHERVMQDYTEDKIWRRMLDTIAPHVEAKRQGRLRTPSYAARPASPIEEPLRLLKRGAERLLSDVGLEVRRTDHIPDKPETPQDSAPLSAPYRENPEVGAVNFSEKMRRLKEGGPFEWPNMVALNWTVASMVGPARSIVELGCGTGCFAHEAATDPRRQLLCADLDAEAVAWAREHRARPNIRYESRLITPEDGPFDLVVSIDVIEHLADYVGFLRTCCALAPRALLTTPNRRRDARSDTAGPPEYEQHVREWTAGEFYWVLRSFYRQVKLHAMPNVYVPEAVPISVTDNRTPLIADCCEPIAH